MELRDLRALLAVVRSGSFTAAAAELGYTQSAVSQQIAALEQEAGQRLLERRPVRATAAGARLAEHAARVLLRIDVARSELAALARAETGLSIAACPLAAPARLAAAVRLLRRSHPTLKVSIRSVDADTAVSLVAGGDVDVALVDGITPPEGPLRLTEAGLVRSVGLAEEPLVVVLAPDHPLAGRASLDLDTLTDAPWVLTSGLLAGPMPAVSGPVAYDGGDVVTLLGLVAAGHGIAVMPASVPRVVDVASVPLASPALVHRVEALALRAAAGPPTELIDAMRTPSGPTGDTDRGVRPPLPRRPRTGHRAASGGASR